MEYQSVEIIPLGERSEILACFRSMVVVKFHHNCTLCKIISCDNIYDFEGELTTVVSSATSVVMVLNRVFAGCLIGRTLRLSSFAGAVAKQISRNNASTLLC